MKIHTRLRALWMKGPIFTLILSLMAVGNLGAQDYDMDYTVDYINEKLDDNCQLFVEKKNIRVEFYMNNETVRVDYLFPETIDYENGISYSESEGAVIITCYEKAGKCIERDIVKRDSKFLYDRCNLTTACEAPCQGLVEAVKHLIQLYNFDKVERTEPFE